MHGNGIILKGKSGAMPPPVSVAEPVRYTPDAFKDRDPVPVFLIKVPTLRDKIQFDAMAELEGVRLPSDLEIYAALRDGIMEQVVDDEQPALLQFIDEAESAVNEGTALDPEVAEHIEQISRTLRPYCHPLQVLMAERVRWLGTVCLLRAAMLLLGVEGEELLPRRAGQLTNDAIESIEQKYGNGTIRAIGLHTYTMTTPTEPERKNSESPAPSPPGPATSKAAPKRPTVPNGKSSDNAILETPA